jgi:hypothetical protein
VNSSIYILRFAFFFQVSNHLFLREPENFGERECWHIFEMLLLMAGTTSAVLFFDRPELSSRHSTSVLANSRLGRELQDLSRGKLSSV